MISLADHPIGRIRIALQELGLGLVDNTLVVFTSDHGEWLGDHGLLVKGPMAYEGLLRVALLCEGPGITAGRRIDETVSTLDLTNTLCDDAGAPLPVATHGRGLRGLIEADGSTQDFARSEWHLRPSRSGVELRLQTVRTRRHKLSLEQIRGVGEMYDLQEDPGEMHNCFDDPGYAAIRRELCDMIAERPDDAVAPLAQAGMA